MCCRDYGKAHGHTHTHKCTHSLTPTKRKQHKRNLILFQITCTPNTQINLTLSHNMHHLTHKCLVGVIGVMWKWGIYLLYTSQGPRGQKIYYAPFLLNCLLASSHLSWTSTNNFLASVLLFHIGARFGLTNVMANLEPKVGSMVQIWPSTTFFMSLQRVTENDKMLNLVYFEFIL